MTQPGFRADTNALRWYGKTCGAVAEEVDRLRQYVFESEARLPDSAWGGQIMYLTTLRDNLERLMLRYEQARTATATRLRRIAAQVDLAETNLSRVADSYDATDKAAQERMPR